MSDNQWYDSAANLLADDQKATIKNNLQYSLDANPQKEAGVRKLYNATGIPIDSIRDNEDAVRTNNTVQQFDADGLVHKAPVTAQLLTDINNTKLLHDDIPGTTAVEGATGAPQLTPKQAAGRGLMNFTKDVNDMADELGHGAAEWMHKAAKAVNITLGSLAVAGDKINGDTQASDWWFKKMVDPAEAGAERNALKPDAAFGGKLAHSVGALPPMLASIYLTGGAAEAPAIGAAVPSALATLGNAVQHALRSMWFPATTDAVNTGQKVFEATGDGRQALLAASAQYTATTGMGVLPLSVAGGLVKRAASGFVGQAVVGENARVLMNAASPSAMQTPFNWEDTLISGTVGSLFGATMGPRAMSSGHEAVRQVYVDATRADAAADDFSRLSAVSKMSSASAMRERDPTMFKKFVEDVASTKDVPDLYVDVRELDKAFAQSGVTAADLTATMPDVIRQMDQARESNGLVKIPMADYATHIAGTEIDKQILHSVKTDPDGMTYKDAVEYQNTQEQQMRAAAASTLVTKLNDVGFEASKLAVHEDVKQQLANTGYVRPEVADAYAALHSTFFANMGAQMGVNASEAYHTLGGAKIVAEDLAGGFKQGDPRSESDFYKSMGIESGATPKQVEQYQAEHGWTHSENDQATGLPTWKNDKVSLTAPRDVSGGFDVFYKAEDGHQAVKYDIKNSKGEKVGYTVLEMNGGFPKRLLDIVIDKDQQGARHGENTVAAITADAGELGIWNIVPGAKSWWDRIGTKTVDQYDGSINFKDYSDARAGRENTGSLGDNVGPLKQSQNDLVVQHNLTAENLLHAAKMGGIAVPSLAITKAAHPLQGFGDITLIGSKDLANPKGYAKTKVFGSDIYSPRYPSVEYHIAAKALKDAHARVDQAEKATGFNVDWDQVKKDGVKELDRSAPMMWRFLKAEGIEPKVVHETAIDPARVQALKDAGFGKYLRETDFQEMARDPAFAEKAVALKVKELTDAGRPESSIKRVSEDPMLVRAVALDKAREIANIASKDGKPQAVDHVASRHAVEKQISDLGLVTKFKDSNKRLLNSLDPQEKIFKGFNNSGDRTFKPHTLDNVISILKKELRGGEGFSYGAGSVRAHLTPEFKSIEQIRASKDRLVTGPEFEKVKAEINDEFSKVGESLGKNINMDKVSAVLEDSAKIGIERALKENFIPDATPEAKQGIAEFLTKLSNLPTEYFEAKITRGVDIGEFAGAVVPHDTSPEVLKVLKDSGVKDIRTYNATDSADRANKIREFEHLFFQGNRGAYDPATRTLALLKNADLSTFLHESGHFFLDTYERMAAMDGAPPKVKEDFQKLLDWFGVRDGDEWHSLGLDGQRESHEKFARGFEAYLMEGKAPNVELAGLFSRFRSWLLNVYKSLGALNVELTPEVRGVMDRMLASESSIKEAEAVRGYDPLFKSAEAAGMTPEVWAEYQSLGSEATNAAIADMQSRSIRDMKWLANAKSGAIKELQQKAKAARAEVRMQASKEIWTEPVYQAWQYLTDREGGKGRQIDPLEKHDAKNVDNRRDSMFQAIAKLGGIRGESVGPEWGLKPADYPMADNPGGKTKVVRSKAGEGMSLDEMGAHLAAEGYLKTDEYGRYDSHEFEEKFNNELNGKTEFSHAADYDYIRNGPQQITLTEAQARTGGRIDLESVRRLDPQAAGKLESYRMTKRDGLPPDIVAEMFGFADGHELLKSISDAEHPNTAIEGLTDRLMLEQHGELSSPKAIERAAEVAIHNEARAKFVATELVALKNATTVRGETGKTHEIETKDGGIVKVRQTVDIVAKAAKMVADSQIAGKTISELRPGLYAAAEATAAKNADKALKAGDIQAAAVEKRAQLLNNRLARAAVDAQTEVNKGVDYLKKFDKASVRENINIDYRDQIDVLLDRYDLRKSQNGTDLHRKQSLMNWVEAQAEQGLEPNIPEKLLDALDRRHYKEMTVEEFRGLLEGIKSIEHLGRLKDKLRDRAEMRSIQDLANEANAVMGELPQRTPESNRGLSRMEKTWQGAKSSGRSAMAALLKMEQMMDWLDARNPHGVFNRIVFKRIADAGTHENDMRTRVKKQIDALMKTNLVDVTKDKGQKYVAKGLIDGLTGKAQEFTKKEMLMLAGNMGNDSNASKLIAGEKWNESAVWDFLHANMKKADWDFVAGMGKTLESLWPEQLAMNRRLGNTNPEKIAPRPFATPHGDYEGWYWPMIYDPARSVDVAERGAKKADALFENSYTKANTDTGRMNTRNANYARPLLLDLDALPRVILDNIHDLAFREAVIDADKFLSHKDVREGIISALSQEHYDQLRPWLQSIANDGRVSDDGMRAMKWFNDVAHGARTRATIVGLGYRVSTMLVHGSSAAAESIAEMGPKWFGVGLNQFKNPLDWTANRDFIFERSGEMRNRMNEVDRDVREHLREIDLHMMDPTTKAVSRATDAMKAHAYQGIAMLDMASALPTWMGAYLKGLEVPEKGGLGLGEQEAIYLADKTVRNAHGGTGVKDLAAVQRGPEFFKLFSMFYTFWNHNVNRIMDTTRMATELPATYRAGDMAKFKGDLGSVMMRTLIYVFGVQIMHHMINPPKEDATEESWGVWAAKEIGLAATAGVPILRDLAAHYISGKDYSVTPAAGIVDTIGRSGQDIWNASTGANPVSDKWLKHSVATAGYAFGLPLGQASSSTQFLYDVSTGKQHPEEAMDWWRGMIHGDMHKK